MSKAHVQEQEPFLASAIDAPGALLVMRRWSLGDAVYRQVVGNGEDQIVRVKRWNWRGNHDLLAWVRMENCVLV